MNSAQNRPATIAIALRAAYHTIRTELPADGDRIVAAIDSILVAADELDAFARDLLSEGAAEGSEPKQADPSPSEEEMLEWACGNVCEFRKVRGRLRVIWIDEGLQTRSTYGDTWPEVIAKAMQKGAGMAQAGGRRMDKTEKKKAPRLLEGGRYTIGQKYGPAMEITEPEEAAWYFEQCVRHSMSLGVVGISRDQAVRNERISIAYYAGYYDHETRLRVERLFHCAHPNFGKATESPVDPATALAKGVEA